MARSKPAQRVYLVGAGPGDPGLLTIKGARAICGAEMLLYDHLVPAAIVALAPVDCERVYVGKEAGSQTLSQAQINELMVCKAKEGKRVVRLKGGDPFVFGRGGEEAQALHAAGIAFEIIPGITSAIAAAAYAGIPLTHREYSTAFSVVTGHEDPKKGDSTVDWSRFGDASATLVVMMALANLDAIVVRLREAGLSADTAVAVIADGTLPTQQTVTGTLGTIAADVRRAGITPPAVVVVGNVVRARERMRWFDRGGLFGKRILITRPDHQAGEFARALLERGAEPILAPTITIGPPDDAPRAEEAAVSVCDYGWVVFTSSNGVEAFFERLHALGKDARALGGVKVAAIGPQTAGALAVHGIRADLMPERFISEEIASALLDATQPNDRILLYRAQETRDVLASSLARAGRTIDDVAAYKTSVRIDPDLARKVERADILTFTSASTVSGYVQNLDDPALLSAGKLVGCIGPITAQAARDAGLHVDIVAQEHTVDGLLAALEGTLQSTGSPSRR